VQPDSAAHTFEPVIFLSCLPIVFPALNSSSFQNIQMPLDYEYEYLLISFSAFSGLVDLKYCNCLLDSSAIKNRVAIFPIKYFLGIFGIGLILKSMQAVIFLREVSE
jgi:hypothetical protein